MTTLASVMVFTACGLQPVKDAMKNQTEDTSQIEESTEVEGSDEKTKRTGIVFGSEFDENELELTYLYAETLMTDSKENPQTGKMESQKLQILIPQGDYNTVNRDYAYGQKLGVEVRVEIKPYSLPYHYEEYTLEENLVHILEEKYDEFYNTNFKDVQISEIEGDEEEVQATVTYLYYDKYNDDYIPYQVTYQLCDFGDDMIALVITTICSEETTGKTPIILDEINAFYGADIQWDADALDQQKQKFLASNNNDVVQESTGWILFELPKGWEKDWKNNDDYSCDMYAPGGDMYHEGCYITVGRDRQSYGSEIDITYLLDNEDDMELFKKAIAESAGLREEDVTVSNYGDTVLGQAMEFTYSISEGNMTFVEHRWWITDKNYVYEITAGQLEGSKTDAISIAKEILSKGQVKD